MTKTILKILSLFLLCALLIAAPATQVSAESAGKSTSLFTSLAIADVKDMVGTVTRGQTARLAVQLVGIQTPPVEEEVHFEDVPKGHLYENYIKSAVRLGFMQGYGTTFSPDAPITAAQFVKVMVTVLGYSAMAENMGGYPTGYWVVAIQKDILDNISVDMDEVMEAEKLLLIAENALEVPMMRGIQYGNDTEVLQVSSDETLLSVYHNIEKLDGVVTADAFISLVSEHPCRRGEIAINGKVILAGDTNTTNLLGRSVEAYIHENDGIYTLRYIKKKASCKEIVVSAENILPKTTKDTIYYDDNGIVRTIKLGENAVVVKNNTYLSTWNADDLRIPEGAITVVAPAGGNYTYFLIEAYETFVVDKVDAEKNILYFKSGGAIASLSMEGNSVFFTDVQGNEITVDKCFEWDIIEVVRSEKTIKAVRVAELLIGKIQEKSVDSVVIDGINYLLSQNVDSTTLYVGMQADFYLDHLGRIAAVDATAANPYLYGWLVGAQVEKSLEQRPQIRVFAEDGKMHVYTLKDTVEFNGAPIDAKVLLTPPGLLFAAENVKNQLIRYTTAGEIVTKMETATDYTENFSNAERLSDFSKDFYIDTEGKANGTRITYISGSIQSFATRFQMRSKTRAFMIPPIGSPDADYKVLDPTALNQQVYTNTTLYDTDEEYVVGAMVYELQSNDNNRPYPGNSDPCALITGISQGMDADGEPFYNLTVSNWSNVVEKIILPESFQCHFNTALTDLESDVAVENQERPATISPTMLRVGDVIQYVMRDGKLETISVLARGESLGMYEIAQSGDSIYSTSAELNYRGGILCVGFKAEKVFRDSIYTHVGKYDSTTKGHTDTNFERVFPLKGTVLLLNRSRNTVTTMDANDIKEQDTIFMLFRTNVQRMIVVYRG